MQSIRLTIIRYCFTFTADGRIDFRDLVKDLASVFKMRIELRQIGVRDETKLSAVLVSVGERCAAILIYRIYSVSIKMAKEQKSFPESFKRFQEYAGDLCAA